MPIRFIAWDRFSGNIGLWVIGSVIGVLGASIVDNVCSSCVGGATKAKDLNATGGGIEYMFESITLISSDAVLKELGDGYLLLLRDVYTSVGDSVDTDLSNKGTVAENGSEKGIELR